MPYTTIPDLIFSLRSTHAWTSSNLCLLAGLLTYRHRAIRGLSLKQPVHFAVGCFLRTTLQWH